MIFLNPEFLYLLIPLVLLFVYILRKKHTDESFFSDEMMAKLRVNSSGLSMRIRNMLFFIVGILMIVALAQPVINDGSITIKAKSADIMVALDISDSMLAEDVYPNRLRYAKQKALSLLKYAPNERIGVVAFAKESYLVSPLSFDHDAVSFLLRQLDTTYITQKGTDILSILDVVGKSKDENSKKYLLILSDGGDKKDFSKEIQKAKDNSIVVFVLGIGTKKGAPIKLKDGSFIKQHGDIIVSKLNEDISTLATKTGGVYIQSTKSDKDVKTMLKEIEAHSEQKELKTQEIQKNRPLFYYPLALATLLLLMATSSLKTKKVASAIVAVFALGFFSSDSKAGMLDFMELSEAKEAYENKEYEKSAELYGKYAKDSLDASAYYNKANALYKQKKYKEALETYSKADFKDKDMNAKRLANMGNAYAKMAKPEALQKAVEAYEKSLKIKEDKDTRENLEEVKKHLKKNNQKKNNQQNKQNQNQKNSDKNKDSKDNQNSKDGKDSKDKKDSDAKQDSNKKNDSKDKEDSSKSKQSKDNQKSKDDMKSKKESQDKQNAKSNKPKDEQKKDNLEKLSKEKGDKKDKQKNQADKNEASGEQLDKTKTMSDAEEQKWLKTLNSQKNTYMYKLGKAKPKQEDTNEKPW